MLSFFSQWLPPHWTLAERPGRKNTPWPLTMFPHDEHKISLASQGTGSGVTGVVAWRGWCSAWPWHAGTRWLNKNNQTAVEHMFVSWTGAKPRGETIWNLLFFIYKSLPYKKMCALPHGDLDTRYAIKWLKKRTDDAITIHYLHFKN